MTRFATCSSDRTVRFWHFVDTHSVSSSSSRNKIQKGLFRNAYCKDMSKIVFISNEAENQKQNFEVFKAKPTDRNEEGTMITDKNQQSLGQEVQFGEIEERRAHDLQQAVRCLSLSPDGSQLACGDWYGNIHINNLESDVLEEVASIEAHETEVLSLDFAEIDEQKQSTNPK